MKNIVRNASISLGVIGLLALGAWSTRRLSQRRSEVENDIDDTLDASFPASDPPSWTSGIAQVSDAVTHRG